MSAEADILRRAREVHGTPPPRAASTSAPPAEEPGDPRPNSPEDVGFSASPPRPRPRPLTDREYLQALPGGAFLGVAPTTDPLFPWEAIVRRRGGRELAVYGKTEAEALGKLRAEVERLVGGVA